MCRWQGGRTIKLDGSDHIPVYFVLCNLPSLSVHSTPSLAVRYIPEVRGWQQSIGEISVFSCTFVYSILEIWLYFCQQPLKKKRQKKSVMDDGSIGASGNNPIITR